MFKNIFKDRKYTEALKISAVLSVFFAITICAITLIFQDLSNPIFLVITGAFAFISVALEGEMRQKFPQWYVFRNFARLFAIFVGIRIIVGIIMAESGDYIVSMNSTKGFIITILVGIVALTGDNCYILTKAKKSNLDDYISEEQIEKDHPSLYSQENAWHHKVTGNEGDVILFGVNIFEYNWEDTHEKTKIFDLNSKREYTFNVYETAIEGNHYKFVAGEMEDGVWSFYLH